MKKAFVLLFFLFSAFTWAQKEVTGVIKDQQGVPIIGINVIIKGTKKGVSSDFQGTFGLVAKPGDVFVFSGIGYKTQEKKITKEGQFISVVMQEDLMEIEEVVVSGYQTVDPTKIATAYTKIDIKDFERKGAPDVISGLEGLSAALVLNTNPANPTGPPEFSIRGISTLKGNTQPLIILDGFQYEGKIEDINPYEVENITLLKDAASAAIYGAKSSNGVIVITTKRGKGGDLHIQYTNNVTFYDKLDLGYLTRRVSSSDLVDIQHQVVKEIGDYVNSYQYLIENGIKPSGRDIGTLNKVHYLFARRKDGYITQEEFDRQISLFRGYDNTRDIEKLYLQNPIVNQHNFTLRGGSELFNYRGSLNYTSRERDIKGNSSQKALFDFVTRTVFSPKVSMDLQVNMTFNDEKERMINEQDTDLYSGSRVFSISSYDRFFDENGNPLPVFIPFSNGIAEPIFGGKDPYEIKRLVDAGLFDETYYPANEFGKYTKGNNNWSARLQGEISAQLTNSLNFTFGGQIRRNAHKSTSLISADSWYMKHLVNNTTPLNYVGNPSDLNIPIGARYRESRGEAIHYLLRAQFGYKQAFGDHNINAFLGAEAQEEYSQETGVDRLGYDVHSGLFMLMDEKTMGQKGFENVYHPDEFTAGVKLNNYFSENQNRHLSAYGNLIYTLKNKYIFSGSIRMDQSNLFGTDPKYRYRPFWSAAFRWRLSEENFLKDKGIDFDIRATYGINGNIANKYGPFDIATRDYIYRTSDFSLYLTDYKVNNLRWERTTTTNLGFDLGLFNRRLEVIFDYYRKNSTDILSDLESDPTFGRLIIPANDGEMYNNGFEVRLVSKNIKTKNFLWETQLNFSHNNSKITKVNFDVTKNNAYRYAGSIVNVEGNPPRSLYLFDYAGLDEEGNAQIRKADGSIVKVDLTTKANKLLTFNDLMVAGQTQAPNVISVNNNVAYKGLSLSFLFIYQGGHVNLKDSYDGNYIGSYLGVMHSDVAKAWKNPGDEAITDVPKMNSVLYSSIVRGSTKNLISSDFIRLRDVTLSYAIPSEYLVKTGIKSLTLNLRGGNLWLWTKNNEGIDPERHSLGSRYARTPRSYTMGAILTF